MKLRRWVAGGWFVAWATAIGCSSGPVTSGNCCDVGDYQGVPSCVCGTQTLDGGPCMVQSTVGAMCTVLCNGMTAGGSTATSCTDQ